MRAHFEGRFRGLPKLAHAEEGQALIMTAVALLSLIGFLALATDVGVLYRSRTNLQKVADAAAVAGASEIASGNWLAAAQASALQNGVDCTASGINCNIVIGTTAHPSAVSVYITQSQSTFFLPVFGKSTVPVGARAAAGIVNGQVCMNTLDTANGPNPAPQGYGITINGGGSGTGLTAVKCNLYDNAGLALNGSAQLITDAGTGVAAGSVKGNGTASPNPVTGLYPVPDPLSGYWPAPTCGTSKGTLTVSTGSVSPGCYKDFNVSGAAALQPGLYIIQGNLNLTSTQAATGVTFYVDSANGGTLACQPSKCAFTTPASSPGWGTGDTGTCSSSGCNGLLLWDTETTNNPKNITIGSTSLTGVIYAPNVNLVIGGSNPLTLDSNVVVGSITMNGTVTLTNYSAGAGVSSPFNSAALLE